MALKSFRDRNPVVLGLVPTAGIALLLVAVFLVGSLDPAVEPDFSRGIVVITWEVDADVDLGPQTMAEARTSNILDGRYLRLSGPVAEPYLADLPEEERRIPLERTGTPSTVNDLPASGTRSLAELDTELISEVVDQVGGISPQTRERLARSLRNLTDVADGDRVPKLAKAKDAQLAALARNIQKLLGELRDRQVELAVLLGGGDAAVTRVGELISEQQEDLVELIDSMDGVVDELYPQMGELNTLLAWMGPTLSASNASNSYGPWVDAIGTQLGLLSAEDFRRLAQGSGGRR